VGGKVWLSATKGKVTQTPPSGTDLVVIEVGLAISATDIVLVTDARFKVPG
jgi:hypothetical protein